MLLHVARFGKCDRWTYNPTDLLFVDPDHLVRSHHHYQSVGQWPQGFSGTEWRTSAKGSCPWPTSLPPPQKTGTACPRRTTNRRTTIVPSATARPAENDSRPTDCTNII